MSKLKSAATSAKSLASKIDDLKHQAKSLDEVIRALKKAITDMEDTTFHGNEEADPRDPTNQENTAASQGSSPNTSNSSSTEVVTIATIPADTAFNLATIRNETRTGDNVTSKVNDELHPTSTTAPCIGVEPPQTSVAAAISGTATTTEVNVYVGKQAGIQTEVGASRTDSYPMENMTIKTDIQKLEDVLPMEQ